MTDRAARQNLLWITPFFFAALHVTHFSRATVPQPISKLACVGRGSGSCNTTRIKSKVARKCLSCFLQFLARYSRRYTLDFGYHVYSPTGKFLMFFKITSAISSDSFGKCPLVDRPPSCKAVHAPPVTLIASLPDSLSAIADDHSANEYFRDSKRKHCVHLSEKNQQLS